ncbi:unnamed protein product [Clonostachys rosea]|uniref:Uncharacterized protein n=1 Tax=Bionectria ochroleuca TaxID=29856 RepID=A0ABY6TMW1_BIOOC|nr:unnamed protein product [Clonostachys rosea]
MTSGQEHEWTEAAGPSDRPGGSRDFAATWASGQRRLPSSVLWWYPSSALATEASRLHDFTRELAPKWQKVNIDSADQQLNCFTHHTPSNTALDTTLLSRRAHIPEMHDPVSIQPWTAARCHRLLRQLESRLSTLRKLVKPDAGSLKRQQQTKRHAHETWDAQPSKRIKHTYTAKKRRSLPSRPKPSSMTPNRPTRAFSRLDTANMSPSSRTLNFPTPVATRYTKPVKHWDDQTNGMEVSPDKPIKGTQPIPRNLLEEVRHLRHTVPETHFRICVANFEWLANLLQATASKPREAHPKSLLGMCLRRIPACVEDIEDWERGRATDKAVHSIASSPTVSLELYEQLEAFGSSETGWRPLKIAARAHATRLLQKAAVEGLFEPAYVGSLVKLCHHFHCPEEAAILATGVRGALPKPKSLQSTFAERYELQPLHALVTSAAAHQGRGLALCHISSLIEQGHLNPEWVASKAFTAVLSRAIQSVASDKNGPSEMKLLVTIIETLCVKEYSRSEASHSRSHALIRVAAGLAIAAMGSANSQATATSMPARRNCLKALRVLDSSINSIREKCGSLQARELSVIPVMALFLAVESNQLVGRELQQQAARELESLIAVDESQAHRQYRQAMSLVCSITQGIRQQAEQRAGYECLATICNQLDKLQLPSWFRHGLRTDGAFLFAQKTKDLRDLIFAEQQFQSTNMAVLAKTGSEPGRVSSIFSGWRWEEGISEWVLPSPDKAGKLPGKRPGNSRRCTSDGDVLQTVNNEAEVETTQNWVRVMNQRSPGMMVSERAQARFRENARGRGLDRPGGTGVGTVLQVRKESNSAKARKMLDPKLAAVLRPQGPVPLGAKGTSLGTSVVPDSACSNGSGGSNSRGNENGNGSTRNISVCDGATGRTGARTVVAVGTHGQRQPRTKSMRVTGRLLIARGANQARQPDAWAPA